jgi:hypothetical protein
VGSIIKFVVILHGIERIWHSDIFGNSRYRFICVSVAFSVYEWAGGTHTLADFLFLLPHVAESLFFVSKASSTLMSCFAHGTSSVSACGSVRLNQVTRVYEFTNLSDVLYGVYFIFLLDL